MRGTADGGADRSPRARVLPRDAHRLRRLLPEHEAELVARVLALADEHGYAAYAPPLAEPWRASVAGLTAAILAMLDRSTEVPVLRADDAVLDDPTTAFGVAEARLHRGRGVTLALYLGLFTHYRAAYRDVVAGSEFAEPDTVHRFLEAAFDRLEREYATAWTGSSAEQQIHELSSTALAATQEKNRLLAVVETLPVPALLVDAAGRLDLANGSAATLLGLPAEPGATYYATGSPPPAPPWLLALTAEPRRGPREVVLDSPLGRRAYVVHARPVLDARGGPTAYAVVLQDVTAQREHELAMRRAAAVFAATSDPGLVTAADGTVVAVNAAFTAALGWSERDALGHDVGELLHAPYWHRDPGAGSWSASWSGEATLTASDGGERTAWLTLTPVVGTDGEVREVVALLTDVGARPAAGPPRVRHDAVTGLSNLLEAREKVRDGVVQATRHAAHLGVLAVGLDGFTALNERHGEDAGNAVLQQVARRLRAALHVDDSLAHLGGDAFLVVARDLPTATEAGVVAERLLAALAEAVRVGETTFALTGSVGISTFPEDGVDDPDALVHGAEAARDRARREGGDTYRFGQRDSGERGSLRLRMAARLRRAVHAHELTLEYRPVVDLRRGGVCGVQALARWHDDDLGPVPADAFLPLAEDLDLADELGRQLLADAVAQLAWWRLSGTRIGHVAVPVGAGRVEAPGFATQVLELVTGHGLSPEDLVLDVAEAGLAALPDHGVAVLRRLADAGVRIAVADFGSGGAALVRLDELPVEVVRLDRRLLTGATAMPEQQRQSVLDAVVALAHAHGLRALVTGVRHGADLEAAVRAHADCADGPLLSAALPPRRIPGFVAGLSGTLPPLT